MFIDDSGYIPDFPSTRITEIVPIAAFISKKMVVLRNTIASSTDTEEKLDALSQLMLCQSSISILFLAYLTEENIYLEQAKHLYRGI